PAVPRRWSVSLGHPALDRQQFQADCLQQLAADGATLAATTATTSSSASAAAASVAGSTAASAADVFAAASAGMIGCCGDGSGCDVVDRCAGRPAEGRRYEPVNVEGVASTPALVMRVWSRGHK